MFVVGPYSPYSCQPLECAAPRRAPILHVGDAMAERERAARNGASKAAATRAASKTVAAGARGATTGSARKSAAVKPAARKASRVSKAGPGSQGATCKKSTPTDTGPAQKAATAQ